jgi:hypothetical protein
LLNPGRNQTLWMSFDKENLILRGGSGYMLTALQRVKANFTDPRDIYKDQKKYEENKKKYLEKYGKLSIYSMDPSSIKGEDGYKNLELIKSKYPIYRDLPPIVKDHQEITLEDLDAGTAISIKELSPECQRLYANVAGASIVINPPDFPDFAQAIDYSINYGFCKSKLIEKAKNEFEGSDKDYDANQSYLRITLGSNLGDSPGIPYVMEIWPAGSYSPIHDHSQANAIIKVLHGSLTTRWFESLGRTQQQIEMSREKSASPYDQAVVSNGDVTWLDDRQFQTHQLFNHNIDGTACITIQCYMYNDIDVNHYENFDYVGGNNGDDIIGFVPNSDWDYENFKHLIKHEFMKYKQEAVPKPNFKPRSSNKIRSYADVLKNGKVN